MYEPVPPLAAPVKVAVCPTSMVPEAGVAPAVMGAFGIIVDVLEEVLVEDEVVEEDVVVLEVVDEVVEEVVVGEVTVTVCVLELPALFGSLWFWYVAVIVNGPPAVLSLYVT